METRKLPTLTKDAFTVYFTGGVWATNPDRTDVFAGGRYYAVFAEDAETFHSDELVMFNPLDVIACLEASLDEIACSYERSVIGSQISILQLESKGINR